MKYPQVLKIIIALCVAGIIIIFGLYALHFGISPVDESFYVNIPYGFALGNRPFIDEFSLPQMASFFSIPFFKWYIHYHGSEGIFLFSRYLYFFCTLLFALIMIFIMKKITDIAVAILFSLLCISFVFCNLYVLDYDTQAIIFGTIGYFLSVLAAVEFSTNKSNKFMFIIFFAGLSHAFMVISYPTLIFVPLLFIFCLMHFLPKQKVLLFYGCGAIIGGAWLLPLFFHAGWHQLMLDWDYTKSRVMQTGFHKLTALATKKHWLHIFFALIFFIFTMIAMTFYINAFKKNKVIKKILPWIGPFFILLILVPAAFATNKWNSAAVIMISSLSILAPLLFFLVKDKNATLVKQLFILVWIPSCVAGIITTISSNDFIWSSPVGLFPAALVSIFYMMMLGEKEIICENEKKINKLTMSCMTIFPVLMLIGILQYYNLIFTFQDLPISFLHSKIKIGPFAGLYTTEESKIYYTQLTRDINSISGHNKTILYENFIPGVLFTGLNTIRSDARLFAIMHNRVLQPDQKNPDLLVKILSLPVSGPNTEVTPANKNFLAKKYNVLLHRKGYEILQRMTSENE